MKNIFIYFFIAFLSAGTLHAQEGRKIDYTSDRTLKNEERYPGAIILGKVDNQVYFIHEGIEIWCDQAIHYDQDNFFKAYGNVRMQQGDTVKMQSDYAEYNGNTQFAFASGKVKMESPQSTLETDSLFFNRNKQEAYYRSGGKVTDTASVLTSNIGRYFLEEDKYSFVSEVVLTNPEYVINSEQLDFYSESGHAYLYGPSTIESETSTVYCERGFYDTRGDTGYFVKNSRIDYDNRRVEGDSLFFNRNTNFASATNNIKVTDTINKSLVTGHYAEVFRDKDSVFITKRAVAASVQDNDSLFIHSDTIMITGEPDKRVIRGYYDVRLFKSDMSGKSDSIYTDQANGLTKLININDGPVTSITLRRNPILWSGDSQMTGDTIHLQSNVETEKLDSLRVFNNAFLIQRDSIGGYNQVKGQDLVGLFNDNELYQVDINKNTETLFYSRNDTDELIGINKTLSSSIKIIFENQEIDYIDYITNVDGTLTPEQDFPVNARQLTGFNWRGEERLLSKEDLFKGKPAPQLTPIRGIPLPDEAEEFFDEREDDDLLLNENSRLRPEDLQNQKTDTTAMSQDSLRIPGRLQERKRDTTTNRRDSLPEPDYKKEEEDLLEQLKEQDQQKEEEEEGGNN